MSMMNARGAATAFWTKALLQVKRIVVWPGKRLSYQVHGRRTEHWFVVEGWGVVTLDRARIDVTRETRSTDLVFVEVQRGDYPGEDDILRLEDDFGRAATL